MISSNGTYFGTFLQYYEGISFVLFIVPGMNEEGVFVQPSIPSPPKFTSVRCTSFASPNLTPKEPDKIKKRFCREKEEKYQQILSSLNYVPPSRSAQCADNRYYLEIVKNGTIVESYKFSEFERKSYFVVGRVPGCDIIAENPTVSRMHAILQFITKSDVEAGQEDSVCIDNPTDTGLYLYDLNSTHGTFLNKNRLYPQKWYRVHVGHVLKFGSRYVR